MYNVIVREEVRWMGRKRKKRKAREDLPHYPSNLQLISASAKPISGMCFEKCQPIRTILSQKYTTSRKEEPTRDVLAVLFVVCYGKGVPKDQNKRQDCNQTWT